MSTGGQIDTTRDQVDQLVEALTDEWGRPLRRPKHQAGMQGQWRCLRCGWQWDTSPHKLRDAAARGIECPPPRSCPRCYSHYWDREPTGTRRHNTPDDPRWRNERASHQRRVKERKRKRMQQLARELGMQVVEAPPPLVPPPPRAYKGGQ